MKKTMKIKKFFTCNESPLVIMTINQTFFLENFLNDRRERGRENDGLYG